MKKNKKVNVIFGLLGFPGAFISGLILDLILERDLLESLISSILFGLVWFIMSMLTFSGIRRRALERKKRKLA